MAEIKRWVGSVAGAVVLAGGAGVSLGAGTVVDLGHLSTNYSGGSAAHISADGRVVAGTQHNAQGFDTPFIWTAATGIQPLPLFGSYNQGQVRGISADGSVIVGAAQLSTAPSSSEAVKWTTAGGAVGIGGTGYAQATGVSADGNTIVGSETGVGIGNVHWVTWAGDGTKTALPVGGVAVAVSGNGSVIVGSGANAVRWTQQTGAVSLPLLPGSAWGTAVAVSGDGSTVVGYNSSPSYLIPPGLSANDHFAFRWTAAKGSEPLGHLAETSPGHSSVYAESVNGDGGVIGGSDSVAGAFVWDEAHGMRSLSSVLASAGIETQGWLLGSVTGISADGLTLVGIGTHNGISSHFLVEVPASVWVPEPAGAAVMASAAGMLSVGRRRRGG